MRLSVVVEWANTRLHGKLRALDLVDTLGRQWREITAGDFPRALPPAAGDFLERLDRRPELLIVSGEPVDADLEAGIRRRLPSGFDVAVHVAEGLEYYPLKNHGAGLATGDLLLLVDSDVLPEPDWLAYLLGSFAQPQIDVVCGQTYVAPTDLVARAFALGWTYSLRDDAGKLFQPRKFYANNIAFRMDVFRRTGFRPLGPRSRGGCSQLRRDLEPLGIAVWENRWAHVDHPPPTSARHLVVRALAHGRDQYLKRSQERSLENMASSLSVAARRLRRGVHRTFRHWRRVGLRRRELPAVLAIVASYYGFFALGGVLTHLHPDAMARHFRV